MRAARRTPSFLGALAAALVSLASACGAEEPVSSEAPPWGLETVALADGAEAVRAVVASLPESVAGRSRLSRGSDYGWIYVADGEADTFVGAVPRENVEGFEPSMTAAGYLERLARSFEADGFEGAEVEVEARSLDPEKPLVFLVWRSTLDGRPWYAASWAAPEGRWLFSVSADSPELREALVAAFVEASKAASG